MNITDLKDNPELNDFLNELAYRIKESRRLTALSNKSNREMIQKCWEIKDFLVSKGVSEQEAMEYLGLDKIIQMPEFNPEAA